MERIQLIVAYDGTSYHGFARQKNVSGTIQQLLEEAIQKITNQKVHVIASGRTDTGVHAWGQCCIIDIDTSIPIKRLAKAINSQLPPDIIVREASKVKADFHPRYMAKKKTYRYQILNSKTNNPFLRKYVYFYPYDLNIEHMREAAKYMEGTHDFNCFCSSGSSVEDTIRTIYSITISYEQDLIGIEVCGNGFLYNMVRIIAGTLVAVGNGRLKPQEIKTIIESKDRGLAGPTAPPEGLTLQEVYYKDEVKY